MKIIALDLGDRWVGVAISDPLGIIARPYETIEANKLASFLHTLFDEEQIGTAIVGYPKTLRGTESAQTKKVLAQADELKKEFPNVTWILWDERLTSQEAERLGRQVAAKDKKVVHARAAAIILSAYLTSLAAEQD